MKKPVLIIVNIILAIAVTVIFIVQSSAKTDIAKGFDGNYLNSSFLDNTGLVENPDELTTLVQQTAQKLEMNIYIYSAGHSDSYRSDYSIKHFADTSYDDTFGADTDGVFYYMDVSGKSPACDHISMSGKAILMYQKNIDGIFTRLDNYLPASTEPVRAEHIENAVKEFLSALEDYSTYKPSIFEYYYDSASGKYMFMKNGEFVVSDDRPPVYNLRFMLICLAIGAGIALILYYSIAGNYKFKKSQNPVIYARNENTVFRRKSDNFIRTYTTKHKIETNNSGSSRSSGGGSSSHSSGGGHGGGSHHR
ncbi:MAG: hypothetical protein HDT23_03925 [Ruminococcus sp.]|nr:hypothetical protein [Ruminococcus sp.]